MKRNTILAAVLSLTATAWAIGAQAQSAQPGQIYTPGATSAANAGSDFQGGVVTSRGVQATAPNPNNYQNYNGGTVTSQGVQQNPASSAQAR